MSRVMSRTTIDRTSWGQSICDLRIAANIRGLNEQEQHIARSIYKEIPHYRVAARSLVATGWYRQSHIDYSRSIYRWNGDQLNHIATTTKHRTNIIEKEYPHYAAGEIDSDIWNNYCTGGYTTRIGLLRANRIENSRLTAKRMSKSHADYIGMETGNSTQDHQNRVMMRSR